MQLRLPTYQGGANTASLVEAQRIFAAFGAGEEARREHLRPPTAGERQEPGWRVTGLAVGRFEDPDQDPDGREPWPADRTVPCWWQAAFWRAGRDPGVRRHVLRSPARNHPTPNPHTRPNDHIHGTLAFGQWRGETASCGFSPNV